MTDMNDFLTSHDPVEENEIHNLILNGKLEEAISRRIYMGDWCTHNIKKINKRKKIGDSST